MRRHGDYIKTAKTKKNERLISLAFQQPIRGSVKGKEKKTGDQKDPPTKSCEQSHTDTHFVAGHNDDVEMASP